MGYEELDKFRVVKERYTMEKRKIVRGGYIGSITGLYDVFDLFHSNRPIRRT